MAKPLNFPEKMLVRFPEGTLARLKTVVDEGQVAPLIRELIERELKRRERATPRRQHRHDGP